MIETIIVSVIVVGVAVLAGRSLYRTFTGKDDGCGCGGDCTRCGSCRDASEPSPQADIGRYDRVRGARKTGEGTPA